MSYSDAPARQGRSPMFYVGIGCLALFGIAVVGIIVLVMAGAQMVKDAQKAAKTPVPIEAVKAGLKDVPVYPGAKYADSEGSRMARIMMRTMLQKMKTAEAVEMAQFVVADPPEKTLAWYDAKMKAAGYELANTATGERKGKDEDAGPTQQRSHSYRKNKTVVVIQYSLPEDAKTGTLMIMRFDGISGDFKASSFSGGGSSVSVDK